MSHRLWIACLSTICLLPLLGQTAKSDQGIGYDDSNVRRTVLVRAIERIRPAVANIQSKKTVHAPNALFPELGRIQKGMNVNGMGTGVIVDERGYIVTNYHVIEDVSSINITLVDSTEYSAEVVARDPETDLALLKIDSPKPLTVMSLGSSDDLMYGETVIAIGNAFGYHHTITRGIISELHRDVRLSEQQAYQDLIQTDASINPGNSGGPLINAEGQMIGLNVAIRAGAQGIGFAIPVHKVKEVLAKLFRSPALTKVRHGVVVRATDHTDTAAGRLIVRYVVPDSPAALAGIQPGDRLLDVDQRRLENLHDLARAMIEREPSEQVSLRLIRDGREIHKSLVLVPTRTVVSTRTEYIWRRLGLRLARELNFGAFQNISVQLRQLRGGMRILDVSHTGAGNRAGLLSGDILVGLHHWETLSIENVAYVLELQEKQRIDPLGFFVIRDSRIHRGWLEVFEVE